MFYPEHIINKKGGNPFETHPSQVQFIIEEDIWGSGSPLGAFLKWKEARFDSLLVFLDDWVKADHCWGLKARFCAWLRLVILCDRGHDIFVWFRKGRALLGADLGIVLSWSRPKVKGWDTERNNGEGRVSSKKIAQVWKGYLAKERAVM